MAILRIELLEDCNIVSGEAYNSYLKEDIFFDKYGLPYIPAWLIKKQLYAIAQKISNKKAQEQITDIFGINCTSNLILDDALIADRESLRQAIINEDNIYLTDPQKVLSLCNFTTAKKKFINGVVHFVRVLNKGLIFEQYLELDEKYREIFEYLIENFKSIVTDRNVNIKCNIFWDDKKPQIPTDSIPKCKDNKDYKLHYSLYILSKTCFDNPIETKATSKQYIPGYEILNLLTNKIEGDFYQFVRNGWLKCSFAYCDIQGKRSIPMPLSYSVLKVDKTQLRDKLSHGKRPDDFDQQNSLSEMYIKDFDAKQVESISVKMENGLLEYLDGDTIKQKKYNAISEGQIFRGFIQGSSYQIEKIKNIFMEDGYVRLGNFSDIGFGNIYLKIDGIEEIKQAEPTMVQAFNVEAVSPVALCNDKGLYQAWANKVVEEFESILGCELELEKNYQATCLSPQFNRVWDEFMATTYKIDCGSVFRIKRRDSKEFDISSILGTGFIGELNAMGYGEYLVRPAVDIYYRTLTTITDKCESRGFTPYVDPKPGRYLIRHLKEEKLKSLSKYLGKNDAEEFLARHFYQYVYSRIESEIGENIDPYIAIDEYLEGLKEYSQIIVRRRQYDKLK